MAHSVCRGSVNSGFVSAASERQQQGGSGAGVAAHDSRFEKACRENKQNKSAGCIDRPGLKVSCDTERAPFYMHTRGEK